MPFDPALGQIVLHNHDSRYVTAAALELKAPLASPTFTGTVAGITKTMVGLGNVDNTSDTAKPVSTAQQTALDLKVTGPVSAVGDKVVLFDGTTGKLIKDSGLALSGTNTGDQTLPTDATIVTSDITTNNATTVKHGWMPKGTGSTATFFRSDMTQAAPTASVAITETEVDFGTKPVTEKTFTITDAGVTAASKIICTESGNVATDRVGADSLWDSINYSALGAAGTFTLYAKASGSVVGKRKLFYTFA